MTDDVKALVKLEKKLISRIISMYHTTRLSDTPFADHIHGKAIVRAAFADYRAAALTAQAEEIERLREDALALANAAAALNVATDGMEDLRAERTAVLDALDAAASGFEQEIPQAVSAALKAAQEVKA